ncbi:MAG: hypothetical protein GC205_08515 [Bacteroidetes bacterium]|nr:hypothetical protein [Bacteroidota bacterium]
MVFAALIASVLSMSCSSLGPAQRDNATVLEPSPPAGTETLPPETAPQTDTRDPKTDPSTDPTGKPASGRFQVALLLPFTLDQRSLDQLRDQNPLKNNRPLVSLGLYEGVLMALDSLKKHHPGFDLFVYDTRNSAEEVRRITAKPEFRQTDLILGPLFELELQEATSYARQEGIPIVSPLRKATGQQRHPSFFAVNPGEETLLRQLGTELDRSERRSKIVVLRQEKEDDAILSKAFRSGIDDSIRRTQVLEVITNYRLSGLENHLSSVQPNVLIVPSRDEVFVNALCRRLAGLRYTYDFQVFGLEDWRDFSSITPDNFEKINLRFPVSYWPAIKPGFTNNFDAAYRDKYHAPPSEYVYLGYDLMLYFGRLLQVNGRKWPDPGKLPARYAGMNDQFRFLAIPSGAPTEADHMSNSVVHIVRYQDNTFVASP